MMARVTLWRDSPKRGRRVISLLSGKRQEHPGILEKIFLERAGSELYLAPDHAAVSGASGRGFDWKKTLSSSDS